MSVATHLETEPQAEKGTNEQIDDFACLKADKKRAKRLMLDLDIKTQPALFAAAVAALEACTVGAEAQPVNTPPLTANVAA